METPETQGGAHDAKGNAAKDDRKDAKGKAVGYSDRDAVSPAPGGRDVERSPGVSTKNVGD